MGRLIPVIGDTAAQYVSAANVWGIVAVLLPIAWAVIVAAIVVFMPNERITPLVVGIYTAVEGFGFVLALALRAVFRRRAAEAASRFVGERIGRAITIRGCYRHPEQWEAAIQEARYKRSLG